jgi:hypothetical protein
MWSIRLGHDLNYRRLVGYSGIASERICLYHVHCDEQCSWRPSVGLLPDDLQAGERYLRADYDVAVIVTIPFVGFDNFHT